MIRLLKFAKSYIPELILSCIGAFLFAFGQVMVLYYAFQIVFNADLIDQSIFWKLAFWGISSGIGNAIEHYLGHDIAFKILRDMRTLVYRKVRSIGESLLDREDSSNMLQLISKDIDNIEVFYAHTIVPVVRTISFMIGIFVLYLSLSPAYSIYISLISLIICIESIYLNRDKIFAASREYGKKNSRLNSLLSQAVNGKEQVIQLGIEDKISTSIKESQEELRQIEADKQSKQSRKNLIVYLTFLLGLLGLIVYSHYQGDFNSSTIVFILIYPFIFEPYKSINRLAMSLSNGLAAADKLFEFLDSEVEEEIPSTESSPTLDNYDIQIEKMNFIYPAKNDLVLSNVDLTINEGERIGIYGPSGSGKSTLAKVLMGWYPYKGSVKIGSSEIKDLGKKRLRKLISYLPQKPDFFTASLRDNLTMFDDSIKDEDILALIDQLNLRKKFNRLSKGLDTIIQPNKIEFSSGEQQRLDIIRALLKDSRILILDEPLSNLDDINGEKVLEYLGQNYKGTLIVISHRYEAFDICERVIQVKDRTFVEVEN